MTLGLVVSLAPTPGSDARGVVAAAGSGGGTAGLAAQLAHHPALTVGEPAERWLPVVAEAADDAACRELHDWIASLPGVHHVDVAYVGLAEADGENETESEDQ